MELPPCPGIEQRDGRTDRQTDRLPAQLCLRGLSYHLLLGEGSSQLIQILLPRRQGGVKISAEPVSTSPPGFCARQVQEFNKAGAAGEAEPPLPRTCGALAAGGDVPLTGGSMSQLTKVTQLSEPCPGTSRAPLRDGEGVGSEPVGFSTGSAAQGPRPHVPAAMAMCHWERPLGHSSPLSCTWDWADGRELELCPSKGQSTEQPSGWRDLCLQSTDFKSEGKNPARLSFVPFNTRVITTSGNLPPTQLCARINWKSIITITNNSLLAFIASSAWRNSHQWLPPPPPSHVSPRCEGQHREERGS